MVIHLKAQTNRKQQQKKPTGHDIHYNLFINTDRVQVWIVSESQSSDLYIIYAVIVQPQDF